MSILIEKIRKARQQNVKVDGFTFVIKRPTDLEVVEQQADGVKMYQSTVLKRFVIDWLGVKELDLIPGGTGEAIAFDSELFMEWIADRPSLWTPLTEAITKAYQDHLKKMGESEKKLEAG